MEDKLAIIRRVIEEHQGIRAHLKMVGDSVNDQEALAALHKAHATAIPGQLGSVIEKQKKLIQAIESLTEGLNNHFYFEEKALPPLFGELLMRTLLMEHHEIKEEIDRASASVTQNSFEGKTREELMSQDVLTQETISSTLQLIEEHATKEEGILGMLERALKSPTA